MVWLKIAINNLLRRVGYQITKYRKEPPEAASAAMPALPHDFEEEDRRIWHLVHPYTLTSPEAVYSLRHAVLHLVNSGIEGDFVECGVWRGGSAMAMALTLAQMGDYSRGLYLFDTYEEGWPAGGEFDMTQDGRSAHSFWEQAVMRGEDPKALFAQMDGVHRVMASTGYPMDKMHLVKGMVEDTIPGKAPEKIALLRLDTDFMNLPDTNCIISGHD